jgi:hypothetical protein
MDFEAATIGSLFSEWLKARATAEMNKAPLMDGDLKAAAARWRAYARVMTSILEMSRWTTGGCRTIYCEPAAGGRAHRAGCTLIGREDKEALPKLLRLMSLTGLVC